MKKMMFALVAVAGVAAGVGLLAAHKMRLFTDDEDAYKEFEA